MFPAHAVLFLEVRQGRSRSRALKKNSHRKARWPFRFLSYLLACQHHHMEASGHHRRTRSWHRRRGRRTWTELRRNNIDISVRAVESHCPGAAFRGYSLQRCVVVSRLLLDDTQSPLAIRTECKSTL